MTEKRGRGRPRKDQPAPSRGRPVFAPSPAQRRHVSEMVACGMIGDEIASVIGISTPTLRKHFEAELTGGAAKKRAELIDMLFKAGRKGNVSAIKRLLEINDVAMASESMRGRGGGGDGEGSPPESEAEEPQKRQPKLGKKEERQKVADAVTGLYAPPAAPARLVVNNSKK